ncbi:MAG TPA: fatty acid desaturase CarF family protein [Planctomycetota bacterium]|nr:fatty acid desaturase CarF family protein [Planctomycetota bacterium]
MRPRLLLLLESAAVAAFAALLAVLAVRLFRGAPDWNQVPLLLLAALAGYLLADLASGLIRWFCDTFFREDTPVIGPVLIHPFREHHRDPAAMTRHGFLELTGNSCLGVLPFLALAVWKPWAPALDAGLLAFALALFATNLFHRWAHSTQVPPIVSWLQRRRVILPPGQHAVHHAAPNTKAYCVTSGWMNGILDRVLS